jgi:hypothetical protein
VFRFRSRAILGAIMAGAAGVGLLSTSAAAAATKPVLRLAGGDRVATAVAVSQQEFPAAHSAANVILTAAYTFPDAMSAGPLGKKLTAPMLLTTPGVLSPATLTEIERVMPVPTSTSHTTTSGCDAAAPVPANAVYVIGGYAAIASDIDAELNQAGYDVVRVAGADRFATSVAVARCEGSPSSAFLATGDIFADALSAGPAAASVGGAVLLTAGKTLPPSVGAYLQSLTNPTVYDVGQAAYDAYPAGTPIVGGDRFATAALVAEEFFPNPTLVGVATGWNFPDALAGGALMGAEGGPLLLTTPDALQSADGLYIGEHATTLQQADLFGGTNVLSPQLADQVSAALNQN